MLRGRQRGDRHAQRQGEWEVEGLDDRERARRAAAISVLLSVATKARPAARCSRCCPPCARSGSRTRLDALLDLEDRLGPRLAGLEADDPRRSRCGAPRSRQRPGAGAGLAPATACAATAGRPRARPPRPGPGAGGHLARPAGDDVEVRGVAALEDLALGHHAIGDQVREERWLGVARSSRRSSNSPSSCASRRAARVGQSHGHGCGSPPASDKALPETTTTPCCELTLVSLDREEALSSPSPHAPAQEPARKPPTRNRRRSHRCAPAPAIRPGGTTRRRTCIIVRCRTR